MSSEIVSGILMEATLADTETMNGEAQPVRIFDVQSSRDDHTCCTIVVQYKH